MNTAIKVSVALVLIAFVVGLSAIGGWFVMWLWNVVVPPVFHGPSLTFGQAWALSWLMSFVSGAFRSRGSK